MMRHGTVKCECEYEMYFEARRKDIACLMCSTTLDISAYPFKEEAVEDIAEISADSDL